MKQNTCPHALVAVIVVALLCGSARAQTQTATPPAEQKVPRVEVGVHFAQLRFFDFANRSHSVGGRVTLNLTRHLSVEGEADYYPIEFFGGDELLAAGRPFQAQFGVKAGKRFRRFGLFVKARPGFVTFGQTTGLRNTTGTRFDDGIFFIKERKTHLTFDLGGSLEVNAARRVFARLDAGDLMIRYGRHNDFGVNAAGFIDGLVKAPARIDHQLQLSAGVGFRLGALTDDDDAAVATPRASLPSRATRFEVGALFTSLSLTPITPLFPDLFAGPPPQTQTAPGFGGRFTYNLTGYLAVEAETNLLPRQTFLAVGASGRIVQGQFGLKAGRRFERFGLFGKVRPGFVSFGRSSKQVGTVPFTFGDIQSFRGVFVIGRRTFFAADVGGVLEVYATRRWLLRFDGGDTIIRYGERSINNFSVRRAITVAAPETHHNFQFSTGVGFRF